MDVLYNNSKPEKFRCYICRLTFSTKDQQKAHLETHKGEKPFKCSDCESGFTKQRSLKIHMRTVHAGEMPYKCKHCEKLFTQGGALNVHMRSHTEERPFKCNDCDIVMG